MDGIPNFVQCSVLRITVIALFIKKVGVVHPVFFWGGEVRTPPTAPQWLRPWLCLILCSGVARI